jgi:2-keto-4-pentenoate hydratase/2-oxohepta-3-ene-1,7-dioic acid hydratase in catechol pathway
MKLVSFEAGGTPGYGAVVGGRIVDLGRRHRDGWPDLASFIGGNDLAAVARSLDGEGGDLDLGAVSLKPPIPNPRKMFGLGLNFRKHIVESGRDIPQYPMLFTRYPDSVVGHGEAMVVPKVSSRLDYEGEMAVVIGRHCRHVAAGEALDVVAGYACFNEGSVRDYQRHTIQFIPGKTFWHSGSFGPWIVTRDEAPAPDDMVLETRLNGEVMQHEAISDLLFKVPELIEYITKICPLDAGDVIITGTPDGVGDFRKPPVYMKKGDTVEVEVSGIGVLSNPVADEA